MFVYQVSEITSDGNLVGLQTNNLLASSKKLPDDKNKNHLALEDNHLNPRAMIVDE